MCLTQFQKYKSLVTLNHHASGGPFSQIPVTLSYTRNMLVGMAQTFEIRKGVSTETKETPPPPRSATEKQITFFLECCLLYSPKLLYQPFQLHIWVDERHDMVHV